MVDVPVVPMNRAGELVASLVRLADKVVGVGRGRATAARAPGPAPTLLERIQAANRAHHVKYADGHGVIGAERRPPVNVRVLSEEEWQARRPFDGERDCPQSWSGVSW